MSRMCGMFVAAILLLFYGSSGWADVSKDSLQTSMQTPVHMLAQASEAYRNKDYDKSLSIYESLYASGVVNGQLLFNLGNAYVRAGRFPEALAAYKGATRFLPRDGDLVANLEFVRKQRLDSIEEKPDYLKLVLFWIPWASEAEYLILAALAVSLFFLVMLLARVRSIESIIWLKVVTGGVAVFLLLSFVIKASQEKFRHEGVLLAKEVQVKSGDASDHVTLFVLHAGTEVEVLKSNENWTLILLADGKKGWIKREEMTLVR